MTHFRYLSLAVYLWLASTACADEPRPAVAAKLKSAKCGAVPNLHALGDIYLAGQPEKEDFAEIKAQGIKTILNLREPDELNWDEREYAKQLGLEYVNLPIRSPESLMDEVFEKSRALLNDKNKRPVLVHCASANRVGAVWLVHRVLDNGLSLEAALAEAKTVGLRSPELESKARDYIQRNK